MWNGVMKSKYEQMLFLSPLLCLTLKITGNTLITQVQDRGEQ